MGKSEKQQIEELKKQIAAERVKTEKLEKELDVKDAEVIDLKVEKPTLVEKIKNAADPHIALPVMSRLKKRIKEIQLLSQAKIRKIPMGNMHRFETEEPQMFITNLSASLTNGVGTITYQKYKMEGKKKAIRYVKAEVMNSKGDMVERIVDAAYIIDKIVVERIEYLKPIKVEVMTYEQ